MLFVDTIAVFLTVTAGVQIGDLRPSRRLLATKQEPTGSRVALGALSLGPYNSDYAQFYPACLLEVEVMPDTYLYLVAISIGPLPVLVWRAVGRRVLTGKTRSIFLGCTPFARFWRRGTVEHPVLGKAQ